MSTAISGSGVDLTLMSLANGRTASGQTLGDYWLTWMANMQDVLSRSPGVQFTRATITVGAGDQQLAAVFDLSPTGNSQYTSFLPDTTVNSTAPMGRNLRQIEPTYSLSKSGFTTKASEPPKKPRRASSTKAPTDASSQSQSGYTTDLSQSTAGASTTKRAKSTRASDTETAEEREKRKRRQARRTTSTVASTGVSELPAVDNSTATNMAAIPTTTTDASIKSTKPPKMELSKATDAGLSEVSAPIASRATATATATAASAPTATAGGTNKLKKKKSVTFTDKGFTDRSEATSIMDIPNKRQNKEYTSQSYRDDLTDVDDKTFSNLSRYAKAKRLLPYQKLAQETGVPLESASEFYALASKPDTDDEIMQKFPLKHWTRPENSIETPYAYSTYMSEFPSAVTIDSSVSKDAETKRKARLPTGTEYQNYLEQVVKIANERGVDRNSFLEYTSAESVAPKDDAGLESLAKSLGHTREDFDVVRKATASSAPVMWTEKEYQNVIRALPRARAK